MTVVVREARAEDFEQWLAVHAAVAAEGKWIGSELPFDEERYRTGFAESIERDDVAVFLAVTEADEVIGNLRIDRLGYGVAQLGMAVLDGWRGKGVGSALMETAIDWARRHGAHKVTLQMWPHNTRAQRLYEKFGFVVEGRLRRHYPRSNGELWDAVIMGLVLDESRPGSPYH